MAGGSYFMFSEFCILLIIYAAVDAAMFHKRSHFYFRVMRVLLVILFVSSVYAHIHNIKEKKDAELMLDKDRRYEPKWSDLDTRPLPEWFDRAKIGIFVHWGVYSVPGADSEWFWQSWREGIKPRILHYMAKYFPPGFTYQEFAPMFTAEFFEPEKWSALFAKAGAKYVVLTTKHHDGFTLFPSRRSFSWNSVEVGPRRDIVADVARAVRNQGLKFGVYHSLYEWYNPIYGEDRMANFETRFYPETKLWPDIKQLIYDYEPSILWSDGDWEARDTYWNSTDLLAWLYNDSPVKEEIVVNDRWGSGMHCHHGDFYNCDDRYNPGTLQNHKWENAFTIDRLSWGYRKDIDLSEIISIEDLLREMVSTVSCGGNALVNVGPTKEGTILPIFQERLLSLGQWLHINGEAIYNTSPWLHQNDTLMDVWYTCTKARYNVLHPTAIPSKSDKVTAVYAIYLSWPANNLVRMKDIVSYLQSFTPKIELLGNEGQYLTWTITGGIAEVALPNKALVQSKYAWTLKFTIK